MEVQSGWVDEERIHSHPVVACNRPGPSGCIDRIVPVLMKDVVLDQGIGWSAPSPNRDTVSHTAASTAAVSNNRVVVNLYIVGSSIPDSDSSFAVTGCCGQVVVIDDIIEHLMIVAAD